MNWKKDYESKLVSLEEAARKIKSNDVIYMSPCSASPIDLAEAIANRYANLENVKVHSALSLHPFSFMMDSKFKGHIEYYPFFNGPIERKLFKVGNIHPTSVHFSKLDIYATEVIKPNVLIADVSLPDDEGYLHFGAMGVSLNGHISTLVDTIIVQVNKYQPQVKGEMHRIHVKDVDFIVEKDHKLPPLPQPEPTEIDNKIAQLILPEIPDCATIQIGLGGLSNAIGYGLETKKNLSVHTEMITDSMMHLAKVGAITGNMVGGFALGSNDLYEFAGEDERVLLKPLYKVNEPYEVAKNDNFISINACLMADLTGQIASEGVGNRLISGTGGALDFVHGATMSKGGKSFICLPSVTQTKLGLQSNIVPKLPDATPVTIPRSSVQYVVTEYGIANLYNKSIEDRVRELINIAHPDFRNELMEFAKSEKLI
ncbi:acetyl-CoA hydrolase/transferase C-terminal domain-containing protein [Tissierella praeacuta]|uniref:acetyl-CoA hydrolase/transferase family protein n=1 Tax=Tissierella praeacuta TaxID=43131 RepID=UPI003514EB87